MVFKLVMAAAKSCRRLKGEIELVIYEQIIEAKMRCLKAFGERIASRVPDRPAAEIHTRIALMNRFSALGRAEFVRGA